MKDPVLIAEGVRMSSGYLLLDITSTSSCLEAQSVRSAVTFLVVIYGCPMVLKEQEML